MGIDWERAWAEFQSDLRRLETGEKQYLDWDDADGEHDKSAHQVSDARFEHDD